MSDDEADGRLERQVVRGNLFTHTALSRNADRIHETEAFVYGLVDVLIEKGLVTQEELLASVGNVRETMMERGQTLDPRIALRVDAEEVEFRPVNCAERLHICKAVCCKLNFALSAPEVEAGVVKWDLGSPYFIRQEASGYCTHLSAEHGCSVYAERPGVCRRYSCASDERIWTDFDNMVLNEAWLAENLGKDRLTLVAQQMLPQRLADRSPTEGTSP
jgi:Fe-S-cluster containining protein